MTPIEEKDVSCVVTPHAYTTEKVRLVRKMAAAYHALGDVTRLDILDILRNTHPWLSFRDLHERLCLRYNRYIAMSTLSYHLGVLVGENIVERDREYTGRGGTNSSAHSYYHLPPGRLRELSVDLKKRDSEEEDA